MSVVVSKWLTCDVEFPVGPCESWFGERGDFGSGESASVVRRYARRKRWTVRRQGGVTVDRCPECSRAGR